jgi:ubiquinone/menaquinone biosynthesis C-methylase UbiE
LMSNQSKSSPAMQHLNSPLAVIKSVRPSLAGLRILDIGCGAGALARQLVSESAQVAGIDPEAQAIREAAKAVPRAAFREGLAENLPYAAERFDVAVMLNSLHHVPEAAMDSALREAGRVLVSGGVLIVIEPLAAGNFFEALRTVEDETIVRLAAQAAIGRAVSRKEMAQLRTLNYVRREIFETTEQFLERIIAVDPSRRVAVERDRSAIVDAVTAAAEHGMDGHLVFDQPMKADILAPA